MTVKIGQVSPLTGPQAHLGKDNDNGARLAIDENNASGVTLGGKKVKFMLVSEDDIADPRTATVVAQKLVDQRVAGVIGHLNSGTSIPASKIYFDAGIPQISPSATAIAYTAQGYKTAFRVMTNDRQQGKVLGEYAVKKMKAKRVAIIDDRTAYGQGLADEVDKAVKASGGEVIAREFTTDRSTDFLAILTSIKGKKPDLVFYGGMDAQGAPMVKQLQSLGLKAKFLGGDGVQTAEFLKLAGSNSEGVTASSPGLPIDSMPGGKEFRKKFTDRFGTIQTYAPYAYDAVNVMVEAMKKADSAEPSRYLAELPRVQRAGVTGNISFDGKGDIRGGAITLYQVKGGKWEVLETVMGGGATAMEKN
ncbi:MAG: branched-chain amino acid ABC transporter substrate-binding protein [Gammaproteobacteria bacterium]|nr:branched-chain amino acid ABC transporter substrate-binding protein [Gammaproteobacteria bacterium]MDH3405427.1 branched-chain amino acid ABC transporter substrate-binding protein [Gammaproteobacteria bacterium]MDH3562702.1 branched-chain amino acid ABC transporter substrate-binding protein [Gammaproteobacteria bacterium]MDH5486832.1 branched-chain amino acid ABC transporter substrate-binding protein [Gammaproteobacteria bacterium]